MELLSFSPRLCQKKTLILAERYLVSLIAAVLRANVHFSHISETSHHKESSPKKAAENSCESHQQHTFLRVSAFQNELSNAEINTVCWGKKARSRSCLALLGQLRVSCYMLQLDTGVFLHSGGQRYVANTLERSPSLTKAPQSSSSGFLCAARMESLERAYRFQKQDFTLAHPVTGCTRILFCFSLWKAHSRPDPPMSHVMSPAGVLETLWMTEWICGACNDLGCLCLSSGDLD